MKDLDLLASLLCIWQLREDMADIDGDCRTYVDDNEADPISKIIWYRTKIFNVKIPTELGYLISVCSHGNPGMAITIYYILLTKIVERRGKLPRDGYAIVAEDFAMAFPMAFPDTNNTEQRERLEKFWDDQKDERGHNKVDTIEYWEQFFIPESEE